MGDVVRSMIDGGVARLTLDRPEAGNAIDLATAKAMDAATRRITEDPDVRVVLVAGEGERFCVGGDLRSFASQGEGLPTHLREVTRHLHAAIVRLARLDAPVVAAVQGSAAGAGCSLALACDLVVAADDARFVPAYGAVGLSPDGSLSYFLPRLLGLRRALDLLLRGAGLSAKEALAAGLVSEVVPAGELDAATEALVEQVGSGPTRSLGAIKRLLRESWDRGLEAQLERESETLADLGATADAQEGIAAFLERRPPRFTGR